MHGQELQWKSAGVHGCVHYLEESVRLNGWISLHTRLIRTRFYLKLLALTVGEPLELKAERANAGNNIGFIEALHDLPKPPFLGGLTLRGPIVSKYALADTSRRRLLRNPMVTLQRKDLAPHQHHSDPPPVWMVSNNSPRTSPASPSPPHP